MYISKKLLWMEDYISLVGHLVPIDRIKSIKARTPNKTQKQLSHGQISRAIGSKYFSIMFYLKYQSVKFKYDKETKDYTVLIKNTDYTMVEKLQYLAHELSHTVNWEHTIEHKQLELDIYHIFLDKLKEQLELDIYHIFLDKLKEDGYISEEYEKQHFKSRNYIEEF